VNGAGLRALGLLKTYKGRPVVNGVDIDVKPGEIVGLLGPNGAGKTTTFYCLVGLVRPDRGTVMLGDKEITTLPMHQRARLGVGYLPQEPSVFRRLSARENVLAILETLPLTREEREARLATLLKDFGLERVADTQAGLLSGGEKRRVEIARAMAELFTAAGINWAMIGKEEKCTGDTARRTGNEYLFAQMAEENVAVLNEIKAKTIVTTCPHCFHTIGNEYPQFGGNFIVKHHTDFIDELVKAGKLKINGGAKDSITYHDPCYLGRHNGIFDEPRGLIQATGAKLTEPDRSRNNSFCCGAGGGQFWKDEENGTERVSTNRYRELKQTGAKTVATGCPFCMRMITEETAKEEPDTAMEVLDIAEIVVRSLVK